MSADSKIRIYKTCVGPIITYGVESRADTTVTKLLLRMTEMRIVRAIHSKTLHDKIRSEHLRQISGLQDIVDWDHVRRRCCAAHADRMQDDRLPKILSKNRPEGCQKPWKTEEKMERELRP